MQKYFTCDDFLRLHKKRNDCPKNGEILSNNKYWKKILQYPKMYAKNSKYV